MGNDLNKRSIETLRLLYDNSGGLPFNKLGIDDNEFLLLKNKDYIDEPFGNYFLVGASNQIVHDGNVIIKPKGKAYIEFLDKEAVKIKKDNIKYVVTTGIALLALIKSFWLEIMGTVEIILKILKQ